jgi:hypothetical protein
VSRDPRAEARLDVDTTESRILTSLAQVATSLDAAEEALVVARRDLDTPHESLPEWAMRNYAQWWLAAARFEEDEQDAVRFLSSALGRWDDRGELYMRATPDDVAAALTEWYTARLEEAA